MSKPFQQRVKHPSGLWMVPLRLSKTQSIESIGFQKSAVSLLSVTQAQRTVRSENPAEHVLPRPTSPEFPCISAFWVADMAWHGHPEPQSLQRFIAALRGGWGLATTLYIDYNTRLVIKHGHGTFPNSMERFSLVRWEHHRSKWWSFQHATFDYRWVPLPTVASWHHQLRPQAELVPVSAEVVQGPRIAGAVMTSTICNRNSYGINQPLQLMAWTISQVTLKIIPCRWIIGWRRLGNFSRLCPLWRWSWRS